MVKEAQKSPWTVAACHSRFRKDNDCGSHDVHNLEGGKCSHNAANQGDGPIGGIVVVVDSSANVKGMFTTRWCICL